MVFSKHWRISAIGRIGAALPVERFQYGVCADGGGLIGGWWDTHGGTFADVADDVAAFHGRVASRISSEAVLEIVKIAQIGPDGKYERDPYIAERVQAGGIGHNITTLPQSALALSLNTTRRGPTGKGRFYIPMPQVAIDPADYFRVPAADALAIRGSVETLVEALNNLPGIDDGDFQVVVASSKGYNTPVSSVRVGRVVDTMRSRRNKLAETYTANADTD